MTFHYTYQVINIRQNTSNMITIHFSVKRKSLTDKECITNDCAFFPFTFTCEDTLPQIRYFIGLVYYILHLNNIEQEMTTNTLPNLSEVLLYLMSISSLFIPSTDI